MADSLYSKLNKLNEMRYRQNGVRDPDGETSATFSAFDEATGAEDISPRYKAIRDKKREMYPSKRDEKREKLRKLLEARMKK